MESKSECKDASEGGEGVLQKILQCLAKAVAQELVQRSTVVKPGQTRGSSSDQNGDE
jgi:hypothetical protein